MHLRRDCQIELNLSAKSIAIPYAIEKIEATYVISVLILFQVLKSLNLFLTLDQKSQTSGPQRVSMRPVFLSKIERYQQIY